MTMRNSRLCRWQQGFGVILRGRALLRRFPQLRPHFWRPVLFNTLLSTLVLLVWLWAWWSLAQWTLGALNTWLEPLVWTPLLFVGHGVTLLLLGIASAFMALLIWRLLQGVLLSPVYADLSLRVEEAMGISTSDLKGASWLQAILDTFIQIALLITLQLASLLAHGLPILGSVIATLLNFWGTTSILGLDLLAFPLAARGVSRWQQLRYMSRQNWACSGIGTSVLLSQTVPLLGGLLTTYAVIGCAELFHEIDDPALEQRGSNPPWSERQPNSSP
jgi:uncharacterized protein involved in cysteine biosynthesis